MATHGGRWRWGCGGAWVRRLCFVQQSSRRVRSLAKWLPVVGVLAAAIAIGSACTARAEDAASPFATVVALGYTAPLATQEGLGTPIVILDHKSDGHFAAGTLSVQLHTSLLQAGMRHAVSAVLSLGYRAGVQVVAEGDGTDLYRDGARQRAQTFRGDSAALALTATLFPNSRWQAGWEGERLRARFAPTADSAADFAPPGDFTQIEQRLVLRRKGLLGAPEARLTLTLTDGRRGGWREWSLDPAAATHARYRKAALRWEQPRQWSAEQRTEVKLAALGGERLDLLSGYGVGGFAGREVVAGYYRNEFRARRAVVLNAEHEVRFAEDRRLMLLLDAARVNELATPLQPQPPPVRTLLGMGVGFRYGIRALGGLPVIVRYGQGLRVPDGSPEGHRRELLVMLAAAF